MALPCMALGCARASHALRALRVAELSAPELIEAL